MKFLFGLNKIYKPQYQLARSAQIWHTWFSSEMKGISLLLEQVIPYFHCTAYFQYKMWATRFDRKSINWISIAIMMWLWKDNRQNEDHGISTTGETIIPHHSPEEYLVKNIAIYLVSKTSFRKTKTIRQSRKCIKWRHRPIWDKEMFV